MENVLNMSILAWIVLGVVAGFIASNVVKGRGGGLVTDLVLGVVGAIVGGGIFQWFGRPGTTGLNLWSLGVAVVGAVVVLVVFHSFSDRSRRIRL